MVVGGGPAVRERPRPLDRLDEIAHLVQRLDEIDLEGEVDLGRRHEGHSPFEQAHRGSEIGSKIRAPTGCSQAAPRSKRQLLVTLQTKLRVVAASLLEVVAEDLVELDETDSVLLEPPCEPRVQLGTGRLRQRVIGSVADQEVAKPKAVLARELGAVRPDQLLADER